MAAFVFALRRERFLAGPRTKSSSFSLSGSSSSLPSISSSSCPDSNSRSLPLPMSKSSLLSRSAFRFRLLDDGLPFFLFLVFRFSSFSPVSKKSSSSDSDSELEKISKGSLLFDDLCLRSKSLSLSCSSSSSVIPRCSSSSSSTISSVLALLCRLGRLDDEAPPPSDFFFALEARLDFAICRSSSMPACFRNRRSISLSS
mmetsp:Transcript_4542/g.8323  ORF Transcript_4542/g.8323 Transcript_4542/m.8323 type:complete len:200 (-) Transcript_4542:492-1091(-)